MSYSVRLLWLQSHAQPARSETSPSFFLPSAHAGTTTACALGRKTIITGLSKASSVLVSPGGLPLVIEKLSHWAASFIVSPASATQAKVVKPRTVMHSGAARWRLGGADERAGRGRQAGSRIELMPKGVQLLKCERSVNVKDQST